MAVTPWLLLVMVLANVGKHHRKLSFALLSQTVQLMLIPSYMGVSMLIAYPALGWSLMLCLVALYVLTRGLATLVARGLAFLTESCTPKAPIDLKRHRQTRKKLAKMRRVYIFQYGSRRLLWKQAGIKLSGFI